MGWTRPCASLILKTQSTVPMTSSSGAAPVGSTPADAGAASLFPGRRSSPNPDTSASPGTPTPAGRLATDMTSMDAQQVETRPLSPTMASNQNVGRHSATCEPMKFRLDVRCERRACSLGFSKERQERPVDVEVFASRPDFLKDAFGCEGLQVDGGRLTSGNV